MLQVSHHTILVVEDEPLIRFAIADVAREAGFRVCEAAAAAAALAVLEQSDRITLVVTDICMPGKTDGLMLTRVISQCWPRIRILVTSAVQVPGPDSMPRGVHFLGKPFTAAELVSKLRLMALTTQAAAN